jgi:uroporphyrinogen-III synthase
MRSLEGRRVGLLESRRPEQLADLVVRLGGSVTTAPAVREVSRPDDAARVIDQLTTHAYGLVVVLTGAGISALIDEAARQGRKEPLLNALAGTTIACRGPKPLTVLRRHGLSAFIVTDRPHTTSELLFELDRVPMHGASVLLLHYGERNASFAEALAVRGADVDEVCLYEWTMPEDVAPLERLVLDVLERRLDAVLFTSQVQFRHLMQIASAMRASAALAERLNEDLVVGAVGPVCAAALREGGVIPDVIPPLPNSVSLVHAVADFFDLTRPEPDDDNETSDAA